MRESAVVPVTVVTMAALIVPLVLASSAMRSVAATVRSLRVTASSPNPLIPLLLKAVRTSAAVPVTVVTAAALRVPLVLPSSAIRSAAATVVSLSVTASLPSPLMPVLL